MTKIEPSEGLRGEDGLDRRSLEQRWLRLTRQTLPGAAVRRRWPIRNDHCFQRVLLDNACGGVWYDHIVGRPAYRYAGDDVLKRAYGLGAAVARGEIDLSELNTNSLQWRRARRQRHPAAS